MSTINPTITLTNIWNMIGKDVPEDNGARKIYKDLLDKLQKYNTYQDFLNESNLNGKIQNSGRLRP